MSSNPAHVEPRFKVLAVAVFVALHLALAIYFLVGTYNIYFNDVLPTHAGVESKWGQMPDISLCEEKNTPIFVAADSYLQSDDRPHQAGYRLANSSGKRASAKDINITAIRHPWFGACVVWRTSVLFPEIPTDHGATFWARFRASYIIDRDVLSHADAWNTCRLRFDSGTFSTYVASVDAYNAQSKVAVSSGFDIRKSRHIQKHLIGKPDIEERISGRPMSLVHPLNPACPTQYWIDAASKHDTCDADLYVVDIFVDISQEVVPIAEFQGRALQLSVLISKVGGLMSIVALIYSLLFVKKNPNSEITRVYEETTLVGHETPVKDDDSTSTE